MTNQISFVMHPEDEQTFLVELTTVPGWLVVAGAGAAPLRPLAVDALGGEIMYLTRANWVEPATGTVLASFAVLALSFRPSADSALILEAVGLSAREFRRLRSHLRRTHANRLLVWRHENEPEQSSTVRADARTWVGPAARSWLAAGRRRCVKQALESRVSGWLVRAAA